MPISDTHVQNRLLCTKSVMLLRADVNICDIGPKEIVDLIKIDTSHAKIIETSNHPALSECTHHNLSCSCGS